MGRLHLLRMARRMCCTVPVQVGATLNVDLPDTRMMINVAGENNFEQINFKFSGNGKGNSGLVISHKMNSIYVQQRVGHDEAEPETLYIVIPEKWCNLVLNAGHKDVHIQNMNEANLHVKTSGGSVYLGRVKGNEAYVQTQGGNFIATMLSAKCDVNTAGGSMNIEKLIGSDINLNSGGGGVVVRSFYAHEFKLCTLQGPVEIDYVQATSNGLIATEGGNVRIKGLDGTANIISRGGTIDLQLCDAAKEVAIDSGEGEVILHLSAQLEAKVENLGDGNVHFENMNKFEDVEHWSSRRLGIHDVRCKLKLLGSGNVLIKQRSWLESLKSRLLLS